MGRTDSEKKLIELMDKYKDLIFSVCLKMTGDYFTAEDITQETFISAYRHLDSFDGKAEKAWLCRIAGNKCIDHLRAAKQREVVTPEDEMPPDTVRAEEGPLERCLNSTILEELESSCRALPEPYNEVASDYFLQEMTAREIAEKRGSPLKTTQTHIYRARELLKKSIRKEDLLA